MFVYIYGSSILEIYVLSGILFGESISSTVPSVFVTLYITDGLVAIIPIPNSLSIRLIIISIWSKPKNPVLNPKPRASDVSGSNVKAASLSLSLFNASFKSSNKFGSIGNIPE